MRTFLLPCFSQSRVTLTNPINLKDLLLGQAVIASRSEFKRLMLTSYLAIMAMAIAIIYCLLDLVNSVYYALPAYLVLFFIPLISLWLIRTGKYKAAKVILMLSSNLVVFWAAINDPFETGAFLFFIPAGIGSFALLAFEDHKTGLLLALFTSVLFLLAYYGDFHPANAVRPSDTYISISFALNYFISLTIAILAVYFLMNLNKLSEAELIQKENFANQKNAELQKVNDELDRFVYSVSHDLRSPLSSILGLTNIARLSTDPNELNQILDMIQGRVKAQDHFIREIIDYSRNTRTETAAEPVPLKPLVDEVVEALKFSHNAQKIEFRKIIPENTVLISDRIRLTIVLSNLIGNAIKYHDYRKGMPFIEVGYNEEQSFLYVQDNGTGVQPEHQEKIFNMFYRGSDRSTGSGLGLFITKEAVAKLGGVLTLDSVYGEGSTFTVILPPAKKIILES
jgi:signal transduction histidine kinase